MPIYQDLTKRQFNYSRFVSEYFEEPNRGYGANVGAVFHSLRTDECRNPHDPASKQFGGSGSYGNGGAMRIAPAALFGYHSQKEELDVRRFSECENCCCH